MTYRVVVLSLLLSACGREPGTYAGFESYVETFLVEARARKVSVDMHGIDIKLVDSFDDPYTIANCKTNTGRITILRSEWENNIWDREQNLFHELGHCVLYKGHTKEYQIMNHIGVTTGYYWQNRTALLDTLFKQN